MGVPDEPLLTPKRVVDAFAACFVLAGILVLVAAAWGLSRDDPGALPALGVGLALIVAGGFLHRWLLSRIRRTAQDRERGLFERGDPFETRLTASTLALRGRRDLAQPLVLIPGTRRRGPLLFAAAFALGWGALPPAILWPPAGLFEVGLLVFTTAVGVVAATFTLRQLATLCAPRPRLELTTERLVPGAEARLRWSFPGGAPRRVRIRWVEQELQLGSTPRQGPSSLETNAVRSVPLYEGSAAEGELRLQVPSDAEPSNESPNSARRWTLVVEGRASLGRRIHEESVLWVHP